MVAGRHGNLSIFCQPPRRDAPIVSMRGVLLAIWATTATVVCRSYVIQPGVWRFQGHPIAYERASAFSVVGDDVLLVGSPGTPTGDAQQHCGDKAPLVLLNGFGVGSFHQHRLIQQLYLQSNDTDERTIYGMDYLGQGKSWPENCQDGCGANEIGLRYCGNTWVDQIVDFLEQIVLPQHPNHKRVQLMGNSVGGHLAVCVAAKRPDLVESLCLLNATPVWGLNLPGWSGHLPAPWIPKLVGRYLFDRIRDTTTIHQYLSNAYANAAGFDSTLIQQIRDCTEGRGGHAAFASIMWSPPISVPLVQDTKGGGGSSTMGHFDDCLRHLKCDVLLVFGRDDPWCKPAFAKRMLQRLRDRSTPSATGSTTQVAERYVELSRVGHCPNHEAPAAVARILSTWMDAPAGDRSVNALTLAVEGPVQERWGCTFIEEKSEAEISVSLVDRLAVAFVS